MTHEQFCYWLQGLLENRAVGDFLTTKETTSIRDHLSLVFEKVTPDLSDRDKRRNEHREKQIDVAIRRTKTIC